MKRLCIAVIRGYQAISGALIAQGFSLFTVSGCRSYPTCSEYSIQAIERHGVVRGVGMGLTRILHCNPLFKPQA